ncbi:sugar ABC transporter permease [Chloroflexia bacterium SDU3-3]|nr:sugar ABC transporter permease [Chloroflexia bacterium SDU3-3]
MSPLARREAIAAYLFTAPFSIGFVLFTLFPMLFSIYMSFHEWDIARPPEWVGLANYTTIFNDELFRTASFNTLYYVIFSVPLGLLMSFGLALILNQKVRGEGIWRTIFYLPSVVPLVATTVLWMWIFNKDYGLLNSLLAPLGVGKISWLGDPNYSKPALIIMSLWTAGGGTVILLAALKNVPTELYEAATIDGANVWQRFWSITIPMISPSLFFQLIMSVIGTLQIFTQTYVLVGKNGGSFAGPRNSMLFFVPYLYLNAFRYFKLGYASAMAWVLFVVIVIITVIQFRTVGSRVYYEVDQRR